MEKGERRDCSDEELLTTYIETCTHSGLACLNKDLLVKIKHLCRKSSSLVGRAYTIILKQLKKNHSEVRLSAFQLCIELFKRAHNFRLLVIGNLEEILELAAEIEPTKPLPPPKEAAKSLKELTLLTIRQWKTEFGHAYKQFLVCYNYLEKCKNIDFECMHRQAEAAALERVEREIQVQRGKRQIFDNFIQDFNLRSPEIDTTIDVIYNCISLLLPPPENFFVPETTFEEEESHVATAQINDGDNGSNFDMRLFGLTSSYNLVIEVDKCKKVKVDKTEENSAVIDNLKENIRVVKRRFRIVVNKWKSILDGYSFDVNYNNRVKQLEDKMENCLTKCKELRIEGLEEDSSDDDDELEEVVKEGYEPAVLPIFADPGPSTSKAEHKKSDSVFISSNCQKMSKSCKNGEGVAKNNLENCSTESNNHNQAFSRKQRLLAVAPKLPYDVDLYHWEDEQLAAPTLISVKMAKWGSGDAEMEEVPAPGGAAALRTRVIEFTGEFEPVQFNCRAPMPNGTLCPRRDRIRCPFHGKIVPRDESGNCSQIENEEKNMDTSSLAKPENTVPDWQDPVLLAQLKAATGIDLKMPDKKKKVKKKKVKRGLAESRKKGQPSTDVLDIIKKNHFPGLTDVLKRKNNVKARLSKKLFNRSALKRVAEACNKIERRKHRDKFGDQFNYMHE